METIGKLHNPEPQNPKPKRPDVGVWASMRPTGSEAGVGLGEAESYKADIRNQGLSLGFRV